MKKFFVLFFIFAETLILCSANLLPERTYEFVTASGYAQQLEIYCGKTGERAVNLVKDGYKISLGKTYITLEKSGETLTLSKYPGLKENINISAVFYVKNSEYGTQTVFSLAGKEYINFTDFSNYKKRAELTVSVPKGQTVSVFASDIEYNPKTKLYLNKKLSEPLYASRKVNWYKTNGKIKYYGEKPLNSGEKIGYGGYCEPSLLDTGAAIYAEYDGKILGFVTVPGKCAAYMRNGNTAFLNGKYAYTAETVPQKEYIPLRLTCDALKIKITYTPEKTKLKLGKKTVLLYENKNYITFGGKKTDFGKPGMYIENNTAMVHKNIFLAFDCNVYENQNLVAVSKDSGIRKIGDFGEKSAVMKNVAESNENLISPVTLIGGNSTLCGIVLSENAETDKATAIYVNTAEKAKLFQQKSAQSNPAEVFIISKKSSCLNTVMKSNHLVHGVIDLRRENNAEAILKKTLAANCRIALLDNAQSAYYLSKFNITVWVKPKTSAEFYKALIDGAGGIITDNPEKSAQLMSIFSERTLFGKYVMYGHRGTAVYACENTVSAAKRAIRAGADYIEFDIWQTKDKEAVVMHDGTTGRICGKDLIIKETNLGELKELETDGEKILTLKEYLSALKEYENVVFNIEIKGGTTDLAKTAVQTLTDLGMLHRAHISSFDTAVQKVLHITAPYLACTALSSGKYTDTNQVYLVERETNAMLTGVKEPALRALKLRGERRGLMTDIDAEYKSFGKDFDSYVDYIKTIPHEISVKNGIPTVLNRLGEKIPEAKTEKIVADGVELYRCRVKKFNSQSYYIYGI